MVVRVERDLRGLALARTNSQKREPNARCESTTKDRKPRPRRSSRVDQHLAPPSQSFSEPRRAAPCGTWSSSGGRRRSTSPICRARSSLRFAVSPTRGWQLQWGEVSHEIKAGRQTGALGTSAVKFCAEDKGQRRRSRSSRRAELTKNCSARVWSVTRSGHAAVRGL